MDKKKILSLTKKQARQIYKSASKEIKELLLSTFTIEELTESIQDKVDEIINGLNEFERECIEDKLNDKTRVFSDISKIAMYLNAGKKPGVRAYFIKKNNFKKYKKENYIVGNHTNMVQLGVIYFYSESDCIRVIKEVGDRNLDLMF